MQPEAEYDGPNFTCAKEAIRQQLLKEQGFLCAYCMIRISVNKMKIEHWHSQSRYSDEQLDYKNMLACCLGNEGHTIKNQTCDTRKGNSDLKYSPSISAHCIETRIRFIANGKILTDEFDFNEEINDVLNLNQARLVSNRKVILKTVQEELNKRPGQRTKSEINRYIKQWNNLNINGKFREFSGAAIYDFKKRLSKAPV